MKTYVFDIETNNFLDKMDKIHCIVIEHFETQERFKFEPSQIREALIKLKEADRIVGHNIIAFDLPAIKKMFPKWTHKAEIFDTLLGAKIVWTDIMATDFILNKQGRLNSNLIGKYSLESFGMRLGLLKGDYGKKDDAFEIYDPEMLEYCDLDVQVTSKLYAKLLEKNIDMNVLNLEQKVQEICCKQTEFGFDFDTNKAIELNEILSRRQMELSLEIEKLLGGDFVLDMGEVIPKRTTKYKDVLRGDTVEGATYSKIKLQSFNIQSRYHLASRLVERCNWKPKAFNADGTPALDEDVLKTIKHPIAEKVSELFMLQKRLGMLADGQQAWLKLVTDKNKIHGYVNILGAGTARATHSKPNLAQIPSKGSPYGKECRSLFGAPKDWLLFGTDTAGLELRMLSHYMYPYDNGDYANKILKEDIHTVNKIAAGLETRDQSKTFIYAFIYGAGDAKIGSIINGSSKDGKLIKSKFFEALPALKQVKDKVEAAAMSKGKIKTIDGRYIPVRSQHSSLNFLLQSAGAIVCKYWLVYMNEELEARGFKHGVDYAQVAWVHDELQIAFNPAVISGETLGEISKLAINKTQAILNIRTQLDIDWKVGKNYSETH